jgi:hypothetical protein
VIARRFGSSGATLGSELQVNTYVTGDQNHPAVDVDADGDFAVSWESALQDVGTPGIFTRRFASTGTPTSAELQVNTYVTSEQLKPALAADADGDFVIAWQSPQSFGGVLARRFKNPGVPTTGELEVVLRNGYQGSAAVDAEDNGDFVVAWVEFDGPADFDLGIFARRFDVPAGIDVDGDGQYLPLTDGLLLLRFGFGFTGATLITGAVGPGCTRCDAPSITTHLQSLL